MSRVELRIPDELLAQVDAIAAATGSTRSALIRKALEDQLGVVAALVAGVPVAAPVAPIPAVPAPPPPPPPAPPPEPEPDLGLPSLEHIHVKTFGDWQMGRLDKATFIYGLSLEVVLADVDTDDFVPDGFKVWGNKYAFTVLVSALRMKDRDLEADDLQIWIEQNLG